MLVVDPSSVEFGTILQYQPQGAWPQISNNWREEYDIPVTGLYMSPPTLLVEPSCAVSLPVPIGQGYNLQISIYVPADVAGEYTGLCVVESSMPGMGLSIPVHVNILALSPSPSLSVYPSESPSLSPSLSPSPSFSPSFSPSPSPSVSTSPVLGHVPMHLVHNLSTQTISLLCTRGRHRALGTVSAGQHGFVHIPPGKAISIEQSRVSRSQLLNLQTMMLLAATPWYAAIELDY